MCQQRNILIINHTDTINISKQLNECLFHLNRCGAYECFKSFKKFSCNLHWRDVDNSGSLGHYEANIPEFVKDMFHCGHNEVLTENGNEVFSRWFRWFSRYWSCKSTEQFLPKAL